MAQHDVEPGETGWDDYDDAALVARMIREADLLEGQGKYACGGWCADVFTSTLLRAGAERLREAKRLSEVADWVRQYRRECEAGGAERDPMLRASVRQSMFDAVESLDDEEVR